MKQPDDNLKRLVDAEAMCEQLLSRPMHEKTGNGARLYNLANASLIGFMFYAMGPMQDWTSYFFETFAEATEHHRKVCKALVDRGEMDEAEFKIVCDWYDLPIMRLIA